MPTLRLRKLLCLVATIIVFSQLVFVSSQATVFYIGPRNGEEFTYEFVEYEGFASTPFYLTIDSNMSFFAGAIFVVTIVDNQLFAVQNGAFSTLVNQVAITSNDETIQTFNDGLNAFIFPQSLPSLFIFNDWEFWIEQIASLNNNPNLGSFEFNFQQTETTFELKVSQSEAGVRYDAQTIYDLDNGAVLSRYVRFQGSFDENEIDLVYELRQISKLTFDNDDYIYPGPQKFSYEVISYEGLDAQYFTDENGNGISLQKGSILNVEVVTGEIIDRRFMEITLTSGSESILFINLMDKLPDFTFSNFIVFDDWEYFQRFFENYEEHIITNLQLDFGIPESAINSATVTLDIGTSEVKHTLQATIEGIFLYQESRFDITTGVLRYQQFLAEDAAGDLAFNFEIRVLNTLIDNSKIHAKLGDKSFYLIINYESSENIPIFDADLGQLHLETGDVLETLVIKVQTEQNILNLEISTDQNFIIINSPLDNYRLNTSFILDADDPVAAFTGSFVVFTDWDFWITSVVREKSTLGGGEIANSVLTGTEFTYSYSGHSATHQIDYDVTFDAVTGTLLSMKLSYTINGADGELHTLDFEMEKIGDPDQASLATDDSDETESPGFDTNSAVISFMVLNITAIHYRRRRKIKH